MTEIRFHGRFGQPIQKITRAVGQYALEKGKHVQVFDAFAAVRPGAPMYSVVRVDDSPIRERSSNSAAPNIIMVFDNSLFSVTDVFKGLKAGGKILAYGIDKEYLGEKAQGYDFSAIDDFFHEGEVTQNTIKALENEGIF